jgi:hypothetical protein
LGTLDGEVIFHNMDAGSKTVIKGCLGDAIVDISWNPGENLMLILHKNGGMQMASLESLQVV